MAEDAKVPDTQFLFKLAKIVPMLGATSDNEKLAALNAVSRLLTTYKLTFTDVGQQLSEFTKDVLGASEAVIEPPKPEPKSASGWNTMNTARPQPQPSPATGRAAGFGPGWSQPPPRPRPQHTPPPYQPKQQTFTYWADAWNAIAGAYNAQQQAKVGPYASMLTVWQAYEEFAKATIFTVKAALKGRGIPSPLAKKLNQAMLDIEADIDLANMPNHSNRNAFSAAISNAMIYPNGITLIV